MQQLQFTELDERGRLVLVADDGTRYAVPVDDRLRAALRPRPHSPTPDRSGSSTSPREVQSLIRAGQSAEEVAAATGWELDRVRRFEGPVLAEREHVVGLARAASVRAQGRTDGSHTLDQRVRERLQTRGVEDIGWDAARTDTQGPWTVIVAFTAGGRERRAAWHYDAQDRSIEALDDEARWLSEDEQALPGGLAGHPLLGSSTATDDANDLMATMRARRQRRGTTRRPRKADLPAGEGGPAEPGQGGDLVDEVLPIEDFDFDHAAMGDPPAAHPRGSAPESPTPVSPDEAGEGGVTTEAESADLEPAADDSRQVDESPGADPAAPARPARRRRERRRLRIPKLPPAVGGPPEDEEPDEPEGTYARTRHDPNEVSFDEFFGTDEDDLEEVGDDDLEDELEGAYVDDELLEVEVDVAFEPDHSDDVHEAEQAYEQPDGLADDAGAGPSDPQDDPGDGSDDGPEDTAEDTADDTAGSTTDETAGEGSAPRAEDAPRQTTTESEAAGRKKGRTSVPSWDDIMFGSGTRKR